MFALALFFALVPGQARQRDPFSDVPAFAREAVARQFEMGNFEGYPGGRFDPYRSCTRKEALIVLGRLVRVDSMQPPPGGWPPFSPKARGERAAMSFLINDLSPPTRSRPERAESPRKQQGRKAAFGDVPISSWSENMYRDSLMKLVEMGIVTGDSDGIFHGKRAITREEFIVMVMRAIEKLDGRVSIDYSKVFFRDVNDRGWSLGPIMAAAGAGIIEGGPGRRLRPAEPLMRYEMALIIDRAIRLSKWNYIRDCSHHETLHQTRRLRRDGPR